MERSPSSSPDPLVKPLTPYKPVRTRRPPDHAPSGVPLVISGESDGRSRKVVSNERIPKRTASGAVMERTVSGGGSAAGSHSRSAAATKIKTTTSVSISVSKDALPADSRSGRPTWLAVPPKPDDGGLIRKGSAQGKSGPKPTKEKKRKHSLSGVEAVGPTISHGLDLSRQNDYDVRVRKVPRTSPSRPASSDRRLLPSSLPHTPGLTSSEPDRCDPGMADADSQMGAEGLNVAQEIQKYPLKGKEVARDLRFNVMAAKSIAGNKSEDDSALTSLTEDMSTSAVRPSSPSSMGCTSGTRRDHSSSGNPSTLSGTSTTATLNPRLANDLTMQSGPPSDVLYPIPLLLQLSMDAKQECGFLLPLILLPQHLLDEKLSTTPESNSRIVAYLRSTGNKTNFPKRTDLIDMYSHYIYLSLALLQTAWNQDIVRLSDSDRVMLGMEVAKVGLDVLTFLQRQIDRENRELLDEEKEDLEANRGAKRRRVEEDELDDNLVLSPLKSRMTSASSSFKHRDRQGKGLQRNTSSTQMDLDTSQLDQEAKSRDGNPTVEDKRVKAERKARRQIALKRVKEAGRILRDVEDIASQALKSARKLASISRHNSSIEKLKSDMYDLTILSAQLAYLQTGQNYAIGILRRMKDEIIADDTQRVMLYRTVLLLAEWDSEGSAKIIEASNMLRETSNLARKSGDKDASALFSVAAARMVLASSYFDICQELLDEVALRLELDPSWITSLKSSIQTSTSADASDTTLITPLDVRAMSPFRSSLIAQYLILRISWEARAGRSNLASDLLTQLHSVVDLFEDEFHQGGIMEIRVGNRSEHNLLRVQMTQPNVLTACSYLVSCIAKPGVIGKKPKRVLYAREGLKVYDSVAVGACWDASFPEGAPLSMVEDMHRNLMTNKADLLVDAAALSISRVEYAKAKETISNLVDHLRQNALFSSYAPRVLYLIAQVSHSQGNMGEAIKHYQAAQYICNEGSEMDLSIRLSLMCMRIGRGVDLHDAEFREEVRELLDEVHETAAAAFTVAADVIEGVTEQTITASKQALRHGIATAQNASLNQAHCLLMALTCVGHYQDVNDDYCIEGLSSSLQTVRAMAAYSSADQIQVGHLHMGLWLGEQLEARFKLKENNDEEDKRRLRRQTKLNEHYRALLKARGEEGDGFDG